MHVVLTGSSSGIGRAIARRLVARGHHVWGLARSDQAGFAAQHPGVFRASRCDVAHWEEVASVAAEVAATWPHVDGLITCAGLQGEVGRTLATDPARWSATVRANLDGTFHALRAFATLLERAPRRAKVVCFSGGGATRPRPRFSAYGVAKTGIVRLVETIAEEERGRSLDINAIAPGAIHTRLTDEVVALGPEVVGAAEFAAATKARSSAPSADAPAAPDAALARVLDLVEWLLSAASDGIGGRLIAAQWDPWPALNEHDLAGADTYTLRRIAPKEREKNP